MARLWSVLDGEPWMVNPARLGILGAFNPRRSGPGRGKKFTFHGAFTSKTKAKTREKQIPGSFILDRGGEHYVLTPNKRRKRNPKRRSKRMATAMQRRMSYVRSFQRNRRRHHRRHYALNPRRRHYRMNRRHRRNYRRNPYPMGGVVAHLAGNPRRRRRHYRLLTNRRRRHYRRNPGGLRSIYSSSYFGLPSLQSIGWSVVGFSGTAAVQNMLWGSSAGTGLIPASWTQSTMGGVSTAMKYAVLIGSAAITHMIIRMFKPAWAATAAIGSGLYIASQAIHDFLPGVVPGLSAYTPLHAYTPLRAYSRWGSHGLASQNIGASNLPVGWNANGGMDILAQRLRRFN